ncbi:MAG: type II secretion system GspH family protein, partial [Clostridia bacterium]|nr:type II secretion system GspH family protein [Clostridia bacterium]
KGFTLTELCVTMAIVAIIGTMIVTCVLFFAKQNNDITKNASFIDDVTGIQQFTDGWLKRYDNDNHEKIALVSGGKGLSTKKLNDTKALKLVFEDNTLKDTDTGESKKFKSVESVTFAFSPENERIVRVTVKAKSGKGTGDLRYL